MVIAIDGPAGAGKSSVARGLAERLGFTYLDSGAMYRAVGLAALRAGDLEGQDLGGLAGRLRVELGERVLLDGEDITEAIRAPEVSQAASLVAADAGVREAMVAEQRRLLASGDWVAEGRDIGTAVAPEAELKVFLTATPHERAWRRAAQTGGDAGRVLAEHEARDQRDRAREHSPLRAAPDAVEVDSTGLSEWEVAERIVRLAAQARAGMRGTS